MADIFHTFTINASPEEVFHKITLAEGISEWWTKSGTGDPKLGEKYELNFGEGYCWIARVTKYRPFKEFELTMIEAHEDWKSTKVGFELDERAGLTKVNFHHLGWPQENEHYKISCHCWAMYLRVLRRLLEFQEFVPYESRLVV